MSYLSWSDWQETLKCKQYACFTHTYYYVCIYLYNVPINVCIVCCSNVRVETISSFGTIMQAVTSKDVSSTPLHTRKLKI